MRVPRRYLASLAITVAAAACHSAGDPVAPGAIRADQAAHVIPVTRLRSDAFALTFYSGLRAPQRMTVRDDAAWRSAWSAIWSGVNPQPQLPAVDFGSQLVIVAALGQRTTGGYGIVIDSAAANGSSAIVWVRTISPGAGCGTTQALTQPVDAARIPLVAGAVEFRESAEVMQCQ